MDSESSSLSDPPPSEDEKTQRPSRPTLKLVNGRLGGFMRKKASPPPSSPEPDQADLGREQSPPHEYVLADNPDIAVIVMFRVRFDSAFPKNVPHLGPQDIEAGVSATEPSEAVENLLCGLLGLVLNRKKNPERGHYGRALEDCLSSLKGQWPRSWASRNPLAGGTNFRGMPCVQRLDLLRTLVHWALANSEAVNTIIKESYKQTRKDDDLNQPLSVQPWGLDTRKRKFYLIEGLMDAPFRIYRESERKASKYSWVSVAGTIDEMQKLARDLRAEKSQAAHRLAARITNATPLFEEKEDKRRRREYRKAQKERFTRPEPGFSLYEGRTRGKRMRYTYDEEDIYGTDENPRSSKNSRTATPVEGPTFTASGRPVRSAFGRSYGDRLAMDNDGDSKSRESSPFDRADGVEELTPRGDGQQRRRPGRAQVEAHLHSSLANRGHVDEFDDESDAESTGEEWAGDDQDFEGRFDDEEDEDDADESSVATSDDDLGLELPAKSLVVHLKCGSRLSQAMDAAKVQKSSQAMPLSAAYNGMTASYPSGLPEAQGVTTVHRLPQPTAGIPQPLPSRPPVMRSVISERTTQNSATASPHTHTYQTAAYSSMLSQPNGQISVSHAAPFVPQTAAPPVQLNQAAGAGLTGASQVPTSFPISHSTSVQSDTIQLPPTPHQNGP